MKAFYKKIKGYIIIAGIFIASIGVLVILIINKDLGTQLLEALGDKAKKIQDDIKTDKQHLREIREREAKIMNDEALAREKIMYENREAHEGTTDENIEYLNSRAEK